MKKLGFGLMRLPLLGQNDAGSIDMGEFHPGIEAALGIFQLTGGQLAEI